MLKIAPIYVKKAIPYTFSHEFRSCWLVLHQNRAASSRWRKADFHYKITPYLLLVGGRFMDFTCPSCGTVSHIHYPYPRLSLYTEGY